MTNFFKPIEFAEHGSILAGDYKEPRERLGKLFLALMQSKVALEQGFFAMDTTSEEKECLKALCSMVLDRIQFRGESNQFVIERMTTDNNLLAEFIQVTRELPAEKRTNCISILSSNPYLKRQDPQDLKSPIYIAEQYTYGFYPTDTELFTLNRLLEKNQATRLLKKTVTQSKTLVVMNFTVLEYVQELLEEGYIKTAGDLIDDPNLYFGKGLYNKSTKTILPFKLTFLPELDGIATFDLLTYAQFLQYKQSEFYPEFEKSLKEALNKELEEGTLTPQLLEKHALLAYELETTPTTSHDLEILKNSFCFPISNEYIEKIVEYEKENNPLDIAQEYEKAKSVGKDLDELVGACASGDLTAEQISEAKEKIKELSQIAKTVVDNSVGV